MSNQQFPRRTETNLAQRTIHAIVATREFAVIFLVLGCIVAEIAILIATQRYEAQTAPPGTVIFWGMSAGGMVVFFAELLKLPAAWVSGVVAGSLRVAFNIITLLLCLFTALIIKDLTLREWDQALLPSINARETVTSKEREMVALQSDLQALLSFSESSKREYEQRIVRLNEELALADQRRSHENESFNKRKRDVQTAAVDPATQAQIQVLRDEQAKREQQSNIDRSEIDVRIGQISATADATKKLDRDRNTAEIQSVTSERQRLTTAHSNAQALADTTYHTQLDAYQNESTICDRAQGEVRKQVVARQAALADEIREIEANRGVLGGVFDGTGDRVREANGRAQTDFARLQEVFDRIPIPARPTPVSLQQPVLPPFPAPPPSGQPDDVTQLLADLANQRRDVTTVQRQADQETDRKIRSQIEISTTVSRNENLENKARLKAVEDEHDKSMSELASQIAQLNESKNDIEAQLAKSRRTPEEVDAERKRLVSALRIAEKERDTARADSKRLWQDTNVVRAGTGALAWFMKGSTEDEQIATARAIFPTTIGFFVAILPALLLELGTHSLQTPVMERRRSQWNLIHRFSRGRRALALERGRASQAVLRGEAAQRAAEALQVKLEGEHSAKITGLEARISGERTVLDQRTVAFDAEVNARRLSLDTEIANNVVERTKELTEELDKINSDALTQSRDATAREVALTQIIRNQGEDITRLSTEVVKLDASPPQA